MKIIFHEQFYQVYTSDPAAAPGRMEAIVEVLTPVAEFIQAVPAQEADIGAVHTRAHIQRIQQARLYDVAALAAGGAIQAAVIGLNEPCFGLIRPPGHHASSDSCWGFCTFNNMAIAMEYLKRNDLVRSAYVLDIDLHFGDGTVNILGPKEYVTVHNIETHNRKAFLHEVREEMAHCKADIIGISAGFDTHMEDWGGILLTDDYREIGRRVRDAGLRNRGGCFALLEGGYNHHVLAHNALALIQGLSGE